VELDGRVVATAVEVIKKEPEKTVLELTVREGRYHLIKRLMASLGHPVLKLKRLAFGPIRLGRLPRGAHRGLTPAEVEALHREVGLK
jgi:pseudouridine synthase